MIAVNCTVTRGEAAVCVVFNVVCGRVRFNSTTIERGRTAVGRGARFGYLYMAQPIYIYIHIEDRSRKRTWRNECPNRKRRHGPRDVEASKSRVARGRGL